jgi:hypothetical protein
MHIWIQQDGCPAHNTVLVQKCLDNTFTNCLVECIRDKPELQAEILAKQTILSTHRVFCSVE